METKFSATLKVVSGETRPVCAILAAETGLSKQAVKDAMLKGAVCLHSKGAARRCRRAVTVPRAGDILELHYDAELLARKPPPARCLEDRRQYSVWIKPAGLMAQGTRYGDHCSLQRMAEIAFQPRRPVHIVHRLDREAAGLMLLAHSKDAAGRLSRLFRERLVRKTYRLEVRGNPGRENGSNGRIDLALDGKPALTTYQVAAYHPDTDTAVVEADIETGRYHQLRRHFDLIGHPVMGDPRYGRNNKNKTGLRLACVALEFDCPFDGQRLVFSVFHEDLLH
ncbi:MAG: RluA family pseudouridine synthase [Thermodesulfobacteriota bacterium]